MNCESIFLTTFLVMLSVISAIALSGMFLIIAVLLRKYFLQNLETNSTNNHEKE